MRLNADVQRFIKTNTRASIETEGLVGNKVINLQLMPGEAPQIQNDGSIQGIEPLAFGVIIEEAQGTLGYIKDMSKNLSEIIEKVNEGNGSIGKLINSNELYNNTNSLIITADRSLNSISNKLDTVQIVINSLLGGVQNIVGNIDKVVGDVDKVLININSGKGLLGELVVQKSPLDTTFHQIVANLMSISESTKNGAIKFEENMEALKRNWLFKSYFEQRGYYDKTAYEQQLDTYIKQINERVKLLDERIETMRKLQKGQKQQ
jgi:phospholipid/cholesterol/gamma-HCH transport system substrate-binding protein